MEADVGGGCAVKRVEFERGVVLVSWLLCEYVMCGGCRVRGYCYERMVLNE